VVVGAAILLYHRAGASPDQVEAASPPKDPAAKLEALVAILSRQPDDKQALAQLDALYDELCDPVTEEPAVIRIGVAPRRLVRILLQAEHVPPDSAPEEARLGRFDLVAGLDSDAAAALARAAKLGAGDGVVVPMALALLRADRADELLDRVRPEAVADPHRRVLIEVLRARAETSLGRYDAARASLRSALDAEGRNAAVLGRLGMLELLHGSRTDAADTLARARAVDPDASPVLRLAGEYSYAAGDYAASARDYGRLVQRGEPEMFDPIPSSLGEARALIYQGDLNAASTVLDASPLGAGEPSVIYYRALMAYRAGAFRRTGELAQPLDGKLHDVAALDLLIGGAMLASGYPETAAYRLRRYLLAVPDNEAAQALLANAEARIARPDTPAEVPQSRLMAAFGFPAAAAVSAGHF
jgi:tetratricopeptide (TPR) repeat protein